MGNSHSFACFVGSSEMGLTRNWPQCPDGRLFTNNASFRWKLDCALTIQSHRRPNVSSSLFHRMECRIALERQLQFQRSCAVI